MQKLELTLLPENNPTPTTQTVPKAEFCVSKGSITFWEESGSTNQHTQKIAFPNKISFRNMVETMKDIVHSGYVCYATQIIVQTPRKQTFLRLGFYAVQ